MLTCGIHQRHAGYRLLQAKRFLRLVPRSCVYDSFISRCINRFCMGWLCVCHRCGRVHHQGGGCSNSEEGQRQVSLGDATSNDLGSVGWKGVMC